MTRRPISANAAPRFATVAVLPSPPTALVIRIVFVSDSLAMPRTPVRSLLYASVVMLRCPPATTRARSPLRRLVLGMEPSTGIPSFSSSSTGDRTTSLLRSLISAEANPKPRPSRIPIAMSNSCRGAAGDAGHARGVDHLAGVRS